MALISDSMAPQTNALTGQVSAPAAPAMASAPSPAPAPVPAAQVAPVANPKVETSAGQLNSLLGQDSPLMQRARTLAQEQMNQRGLVNSSMAVGAAQGAMIDRITPFAQQDAQQAYNDRQGLLSRQFTSAERAGQQAFQAGQQSTQNELAVSQAALDRSQQTTLADKSAAAQAGLQTAQQNFTAAQTLVQFDQRMAELGYSASLNKANVPQTFSANVAATAMNQVNALLADPNLSAEKTISTPTGMISPKEAAIKNVVDYANSTMAWASAFYGSTNNVAIPTSLSLPGAAAPSTAAPAPVLPAPAAPKLTMPISPIAPAPVAPAPASGFPGLSGSYSGYTADGALIQPGQPGYNATVYANAMNTGT